VAGSVAIHLDGTNVDWASAAIAVGKTTAYAGATSEATVNEAFAVGSGGAITFTGTDIYIQSVAEETVAGLAQEQANDFDNQEVNIDMIDGEVDYID